MSSGLAGPLREINALLDDAGIPYMIVGVGVPMASAEDTISPKLEWAALGSSDRQLDDVAGILRVRGDSLDTPYIQRWVVALGLDDLWQRARAT